MRSLRGMGEGGGRGDKRRLLAVQSESDSSSDNADTDPPPHLPCARVPHPPQTEDEGETPSQTQAVGIVQRRAEGSAGPRLKHTGCTPTGHPSDDA